MNGTTAMLNDLGGSLSKKHFDGFEASTQQWMDNINQRQRNYVGAWKEKKWADMDQEEKARNAGELNEGEHIGGMPLAVSTPTDPPSGKGKQNLVNLNKIVKVPRPDSQGWRTTSRSTSNSQAKGLSLMIKYGKTSASYNRVYVDIRLHSAINHYERGIKGNEIWKFRIYFRDNLNGRFR